MSEWMGERKAIILKNHVVPKYKSSSRRPWEELNIPREI